MKLTSSHCLFKLALLFVLLPSASAFAQTRKPNIVFVLIDDYGWADTGCYGSTYHRRPNIDALAARGMRFTDAYAAAPPVMEGIACIAAVRAAVGANVQIMVDAHSVFDVPLALEVAARLEPYQLTWYEEPVAPEQTTETLAIRRAVKQPMAGGEILFGTTGFAPLCRERAVNVIMPDAKLCGGLLEMSRIAAVAEVDGVAVSPHNPSRLVATAATIQLCAGLSNFGILKLQWGEVPWRGDLLAPPEKFVAGQIAVPTQPGFGFRFNERLARRYSL